MVFPAPSFRSDQFDEDDVPVRQHSARSHDPIRDHHPQRFDVMHANPTLPSELLVRAPVDVELRILRDLHQDGTIQNPDDLLPLFLEDEHQGTLVHGSLRRNEFMAFLQSKMEKIWEFMSDHRQDPAFHHLDAFFPDGGHTWQVSFTLDDAGNLEKSYYLRNDKSKMKSESPVFRVIYKCDSPAKGVQIIFVPYNASGISTLLEKDQAPSSLKNASDGNGLAKVGAWTRERLGQFLNYALTLGAPPGEDTRHAEDPRYRDELRFKQAAMRTGSRK